MIALSHVRVIDGTGGPASDDVMLLIEDGRIARMTASSGAAIPVGAKVLDLTGLVVTPGLTDMHYHVTTGAMRYRRDSAGNLDRLLALVRRLHREGVQLTTGSDLASPWVIPGVALHQELALLESAGLTRTEVLRMATRNGPEALGIAHQSGTIEVGKRADLVVLEADPLAEISHTRKIRYVILGGSIYRPSEQLAGR